MKYLPIIWLSLLLILTACSKDVDIFTPNDPLQLQQTKDSLVFAQFVSLAKPDAQRWTWDANEVQNITISNLVAVQFPAAAFVHADQSPVEGTIEVAFIPAINPGALLLSDISCLADYQLLELGGVVEIQAFQQGQPLELAEGATITVKIKAIQSSENFSVFLHDQATDNWVTANSIYPEGDFNVYDDELYDPEGDTWILAHRFQSPGLGRIACGRIAPALAGTTTVCLDVPEAFSASNTKIYAVLDAFNSIVPLALENGSFCSPLLPTGSSAEFVLVGVANEEFYYDRISMDLNDNIQTGVLEPSIYSVDDLIVLLSSF